MASIRERLKELEEFRAIGKEFGWDTGINCTPARLKAWIRVLKEERDAFLAERNRALDSLKFTHTHLKKYAGQKENPGGDS